MVEGKTVKNRKLHKIYQGRGKIKSKIFKLKKRQRGKEDPEYLSVTKSNQGKILRAHGEENKGPRGKEINEC